MRIAGVADGRDKGQRRHGQSGAGTAGFGGRFRHVRLRLADSYFATQSTLFDT
jgi:hypothetical protein